MNGDISSTWKTANSVTPWSEEIQFRKVRPPLNIAFAEAGRSSSKYMHLIPTVYFSARLTFSPTASTSLIIFLTRSKSRMSPFIK
jgi:hypothetical protein